MIKFVTYSGEMVHNIYIYSWLTNISQMNIKKIVWDAVSYYLPSRANPVTETTPSGQSLPELTRVSSLSLCRLLRCCQPGQKHESQLEMHTRNFIITFTHLSSLHHSISTFLTKYRLYYWVGNPQIFHVCRTKMQPYHWILQFPKLYHLAD